MQALAVEVFGDPEVGLWRVERRVVQPADAGAAFDGGRQREVDAVVEDVAGAAARQHRAERAHVERERPAAERGAALGDDVDHGEEGAVAVDRGCRAADDLDALEGRRIHPELGADLGLAEDVVVDAVAVDEQQDAAVVVAGLAEATDAQQAEVAVVADVHAADAAEDVGQRPVAEAGDLVSGDERHRRRRLGHRLQALGGAVDLSGVESHELLEAEVGQRRLRGGRARQREEQRDPERQPTEGLVGHAHRSGATNPVANGQSDGRA